MHRAIYRDRIESTKKGLVRIVNASWKNYSLDVLKVDEDGKMLCRNLYFVPISGYMVEFQDCGVQKWGRPMIEISSSFDYTFSSEKDIETVCKVYPDFKWTVQKSGRMTNDEMMKVLAMWKKNPKIELLLGAGFKKIAMNNNFYRLSEQMQKKFIKLLLDNRENESAKNWSLNDISRMVSQQINAKQLEELNNFNSWRRIKFSWNEYQFLKNKSRQFIDIYGDYKKMARRAGHDFSEAYWYRPKNLKAMHDRVIEECRNLDAIEFLGKNEKRQAQYLKAVGKKNLAKVIEEKQWKVYVPDSIADIKMQAETLHQCLISCDYIAKCISKSCILVFIRYKGRPVATAEIKPGNVLGQFYGDERAKNIYPSATAKKKLEMWMALNERKVA